MAIRQIVKLGDEVLRKKSFEVTDFGEKTHQLLEDMKDTLEKAQGVGLAAVQVGVLRKIFIILKGDKIEEGVYEFLNPEIISTSGEQYDTEGCLSVPGKWGEVKRPNKLTIKYQDRFGKPQKLKAEGFLARAICHENDHLNGVIYIDKADNLRSETKK